MNTEYTTETNEYARCINASKRIRWDIDNDVIKGRTLEASETYLPDAMTRVSRLEFLTESERRLMSQIQGRTYANMFGLVERFINCKVLDVSTDHHLGDQVALEALIRFSDEEIKHQELFRRIEKMAAEGMEEGYAFLPQPNEVAGVVLEKCSWAVLGLTYLIELFTQSHYKTSIEPLEDISPLFRDVFFYHWKEESQHARLDALEWRREDAKLSDQQRDQAVDDMIALVGAVDGLLQVQALADAAYFMNASGSSFYEENRLRIEQTVLSAYRWQYIISGVEDPAFQNLLKSFITPEQETRIGVALTPILAAN